MKGALWRLLSLMTTKNKMGAYSESELFELWKGFREQHDATSILMDFALCDKAKAKALIADFEVRYAGAKRHMEE